MVIMYREVKVKAGELLRRMRGGEFPKGTSIRYMMVWTIGNGEPCTRAVNALLRQGLIYCTHATVHDSWCNLTEKGKAKNMSIYVLMRGDDFVTGRLIQEDEQGLACEPYILETSPDVGQAMPFKSTYAVEKFLWFIGTKVITHVDELVRVEL